MTRPPEVLPDTNSLLRYLLQDDAGQYAVASDFFEKVRTGQERVRVLEGVLVEAVYVLTKHYGVSRRDTSEALIGLLHYKGVMNPDKEALIDGLRRFSDTSLDPVDCLLLARAEHDGATIFSFDKGLNKAAEKGREKKR